MAALEPAVRVLYWFRTDLRLHSSPGLHTALNLNPEVLYPVWTWDPEYVFAHKVGINRFNFLLQSMQDLSNSLTDRNPKTKLHVLRGSPQSVLPILFKEWRISHLVYEKDTAEYAAVRDRQINALASHAGIKVFGVLGHTLYDPEAAVKANGGKATMSLSSWRAAVKGLPPPPRPLPAPDILPPAGDPGFSSLAISQDSVSLPAVDLNSADRVRDVSCYDTLAGPSGDFSIPTLEELGLPKATTSIRGGETEALRRLAAYCADPERVASFAKPKTSPADFDPPATTLLSPYLKFGCLGIHEFLWRVRDTIAEYKKSSAKANAKITKEPENLEGQIFFREMYYTAECAQGLKFGQIHGNSVCRFIDWRLPNVYNPDGTKVLPRPVGDPIAEARLLAWTVGQTGFPWIDAIMRQLRLEGWIHHLARHSVACFLTRGQCYISWERGAEVFDEYLLDWDPCSNPGNWMWLSASAFYSMYYRVYGVKSFPTKYDKTGKLVRKYCPELASFPDKYIYSPHLAPLDVQRAAGCIIGKDYPEPMLDDALEKDRCLARIKVAYAKNFHGADQEVLDGTAGDLLKKAYEDALSRSSPPGRKRVPKKREHEESGGDKAEAGSPKKAKNITRTLDGYITKSEGSIRKTRIA